MPARDARARTRNSNFAANGRSPIAFATTVSLPSLKLPGFCTRKRTIDVSTVIVAVVDAYLETKRSLKTH
jgi:hypothetical protein